MIQFNFINKVWIKNAPRGQTIRILLVALGALMILITLIQILMDDADEINWLLGIILPTVLILQAFLMVRQGKYRKTKTYIECSHNNVRMVLYNINRFDGAGEHDEEYRIVPDIVNQFQYSRVLASIRFIGRFEANNAQGADPQDEIVLYPPAGEIQALISALEGSLNRDITHMDR